MSQIGQRSCPLNKKKKKEVDICPDLSESLLFRIPRMKAGKTEKKREIVNYYYILMI